MPPVCTCKRSQRFGGSLRHTSLPLQIALFPLPWQDPPSGADLRERTPQGRRQSLPSQACASPVAQQDGQNSTPHFEKVAPCPLGRNRDLLVSSRPMKS